MANRGDTQRELLEDLRGIVSRYLDAEKRRLITERSFLKSILKANLGDAQKKSVSSDVAAVLKQVGELLGVRKDV
jgi:hypothetical protein